MDGRSSHSRNEGSPPATWNEGSPKAGTSSWTGSWPGFKHGTRPERAEIRGMAMAEGAGASVHDWMFSGWSDAQSLRPTPPSGQSPDARGLRDRGTTAHRLDRARDPSDPRGSVA